MMNHTIFLDKFHAELEDSIQERMMKDYMLSLSSTDLHSFIFDNLKDIRTYVETADLSETQRLSIATDLDKAKNMLQRPIKQAA
jgi:hypothetical protein